MILSLFVSFLQCTIFQVLSRTNIVSRVSVCIPIEVQRNDKATWTASKRTMFDSWSVRMSLRVVSMSVDCLSVRKRETRISIQHRSSSDQHDSARRERKLHPSHRTCRSSRTVCPDLSNDRFELLVESLEWAWQSVLSLPCRKKSGITPVQAKEKTVTTRN